MHIVGAIIETLSSACAYVSAIFYRCHDGSSTTSSPVFWCCALSVVHLWSHLLIACNVQHQQLFMWHFMRWQSYEFAFGTLTIRLDLTMMLINTTPSIYLLHTWVFFVEVLVKKLFFFQLFWLCCGFYWRLINDQTFD